MTKKQIEEKIAEVKEQMDNFEVSDYISSDDYDSLIDDCNEMVQIGGLTYSPSQVLSNIDPVAYRCGFNDYCDGIDKEDIKEYQDLQDELDALESELEELEDKNE